LKKGETALNPPLPPFEKGGNWRRDLRKGEDGSSLKKGEDERGIRKRGNGRGMLAIKIKKWI